MSSLSSHPLLSSASDFRGAGILVVRPAACGRRSAPGASLGRKLSGARRAYCCLPEVVQVRRFCPILEGETFQNKKELGFVEWQAVPDIWKSSAEKYGDRIALIDRYHDPPSEFTYKQLEQEILFFSEGLRVLGVNPEEKVAIFADNSCRCLVADQGETVEPSVLEEAALRSSLIQQIVVIGQGQRRLGALIFPNKGELLATAKTYSLVPYDASEIETRVVMKLLSDELTN